MSMKKPKPRDRIVLVHGTVEAAVDIHVGARFTTDGGVTNRVPHYVNPGRYRLVLERIGGKRK